LTQRRSQNQKHTLMNQTPHIHVVNPLHVPQALTIVVRFGRSDMYV